MCKKAVALVQLDKQPGAQNQTNQSAAQTNNDDDDDDSDTQADLARLKADTKSAEGAAQKESDQFIKGSEIGTTENDKCFEFKTAKEQYQSEASLRANVDLDGHREETCRRYRVLRQSDTRARGG